MNFNQIMQTEDVMKITFIFFICKCLSVCALYCLPKIGAFNCPVKEIHWSFSFLIMHGVNFLLCTLKKYFQLCKPDWIASIHISTTILGWAMASKLSWNKNVALGGNSSTNGFPLQIRPIVSGIFATNLKPQRRTSTKHYDTQDQPSWSN